MKAERNDIGSFDAILDEKYGKIGTPERNEFHREAYAYCVGQMICDARKKEKMTQAGNLQMFVLKITVLRTNIWLIVSK